MELEKRDGWGKEEDGERFEVCWGAGSRDTHAAAYEKGGDTCVVLIRNLGLFVIHFSLTVVRALHVYLLIK